MALRLRAGGTQDSGDPAMFGSDVPTPGPIGGRHFKRIAA